MLELKRVSWKNFLSYGDYTTTLELANQGQCLITGTVVDDDSREVYDNALPFAKRKSNGAGKSTIPAVIQWVLFGRTMHAAAPGNGVVNWFTGKDCWAQIEFKNGDSITRTRNLDGKNELIYVKDGDENRSVADTLSTAKAQQAQLNRVFGLDWEIFSGSAFFNQYGHPWMEMADQNRKKALERLLHVDRFAYYSRVAKGKCDKLDTAAERANNRKLSLEKEIERLEGEIERLTEASNHFAERQQQRRQQALDAAIREEKLRDAIELPDLEKLKAKWEVVQKIEAKIQEYRQQANGLSGQIAEHDSNAQAAQRKINLWQEKGGKVCTACEQPVPHEHVAGRIEPLQQTVTSETEAATALRQQQNDLRTKIKGAEVLLVQKKPKLTMQDARGIHARWKQHDQEARRLRQLADSILEETNPHDATITTARERIAECRTDIEKAQREVEQQSLLNRHYNYIYRAYNDRAKIKSFVFKEHVPFINARLRHYLDAFGLDIRVELTDSLGVTGNLWDYRFESGGERKRTDVAFMLATFDFHEHMYGRQSNVLVLDEVDGRLDDDGIDSLINIIKNDLAPRVETILIISHRNMMFDVFPREIKVKRVQRLSYLEAA